MSARVGSFADLEIKSSYDSDDDDILNDFYNPVLANSVEYCRIAGFFTSAALAVAARGIKGLLKNDGTMKLIVSPKLNEQDVGAIRTGVQKPEEIIERAAITDLDSIEDEFVRDHVMALGWLIAKQKLEIRIAIVEDKNGRPLDADSILRNGIFHQKVGIFTDTDGRKLSFSGSVNETAKAWTENIEEFKVFREWVEAEREHFLSDHKKFNKYWDGESLRVRIINAPRAIKEKLIQMAPENIETLKLGSIKKESKRKVINPWPHQEQAVSAFRSNDYRGIFKMATGTGKTHTALLSLEEFFQEKKKYGNRVLIIVPQHNLLEQWATDLYEFYFENAFVLTFDSKTSTIDQREARKTWKRTFGVNDNFNVFLVSTVDSIKNFKPFNMYKPDFIIADEVHSYGTEKRMNALNDKLGSLKYGLGLSATPERIYDPEGTERVFDYFGPLVYEYNLKEAQKDGILAKYSYYPYLVDLTEEEEEQVAELTKEISAKIAMDFKNELSEKEKAVPKAVKDLMRQRATKIKKARNKLNALKGILNDNKDKLNQCIVYCEDAKQLLAIQEVFEYMNIESYIKYYADIKDREMALNLFKDNNCNFILSMHCLDQGVNIPSCESIILLSSSGNPREYIQRRGRVLRNPPNEFKPIVKIFDIFAFPRNLEEEYRGFIMTQMIRAWEFISCSQTPEAKMKFQKIQDAYGINSDEITEIIERW